MRDSRKVVFFDVGGTLVEVSPSVGHVYALACAQMGAHVLPADVQRAFDQAWVSLSEDVPRGSDRYAMFPGGEHEWWEKVSCFAFDLCGVPAARRPAVPELRAVFAKAESWHVYPEARAALATLKDAGFRLGVISNWDSRLPALMRRLGLDGYFESLVYSAGTGYEKPHPAIFSTALKALRVEASQAVHIGDRIDEDYAGARAAGLGALLLCRGIVPPDLRDEVRRWGDEADLVLDLAAAVRRVVE